MQQRSITLNSVYNFVLKVFRLIVPILVGPYIQRLFDPELYGYFNDASTWVDLALIFGTEGDGLSHRTIAHADLTVRIPMSHGVDSLNVAASSAVAFYSTRVH